MSEQLGASFSTVKTAQTLLSALGYQVQIIGVEDDRTHAAILKFQAATYEEQTGTVSEGLVLRLAQELAGRKCK